MAYIILTANGEEIDRLELTGPLTVGRSPECDVAVRDILMSRRHCRIEPLRNGWRIIDIDSKNGTRLQWRKIQRHILVDRDQLRLGRTWLVFHAGAFVPAPAGTIKKAKLVRPADPAEALSGTVHGFILADEPTGPVEHDHDHIEQAQPLPADNSCDLFSSSPNRPAAPFFAPWEPRPAESEWSGEIFGNTLAVLPSQARRLRPMPRPLPRPIGSSPAPARSRLMAVDLSLQVHADEYHASAPSLRRRNAHTLIAIVVTAVVVLATTLLATSR